MSDSIYACESARTRTYTCMCICKPYPNPFDEIEYNNIYIRMLLPQIKTLFARSLEQPLISGTSSRAAILIRLVHLVSPLDTASSTFSSKTDRDCHIYLYYN